MSTGVQEILRIEVDREALDKVADGTTLHFPLNDEGTRVVELTLGESDDGREESPRGVE